MEDATKRVADQVAEHVKARESAKRAVQRQSVAGSRVLLEAVLSQLKVLDSDESPTDDAGAE